MQDSNIVFKVTTVGVEEATAKMDSLGATITRLTYNANGTVTASGKLSSTLDEQSRATGRVSAATDRASRSQGNYFVHIAKTTVQSALVNKAFLGLVQSAGDAVKQVDLFSNFPASMAALGLSSKDASDSLLVLRNYAAQAGINLTEATTSVARFAEVTKNIKAATAEFIGVKNALIAGGAGAEVQSNALEQLTQAYSRGKPQLIEWRSLMVAMPAQLNQVAKAMNLPNAQALGESLTQGKVSMQDFLTELTKLSTGTGPIAAQALARMQGIQFAANVMKNALTNGLAAIYQTVGKQNIISFFTFLTQVITVLTQWAVLLINTLITLFNIVSKIFGGPQIAHFSSNAQSASDALGTGANNANDMADGLGNAADNAAKINKSLASFDKMNVLPDKTSGSGASGVGTGAGGLSPVDAAALDDIFGNIGKKLQEISGWAKIFAGILAGIIGLKFAKGILDQLNDMIKTFQTAGKNADDFAKKVGKLGKSAADAFKGTPAAKDAEKQGTSMGSSILSGLAAALGAGAGKVWRLIFVPLGAIVSAAVVPIIAAMTELVIGLAVILGLPIEAVVALIAAAVAVIVALIFVIWKNWDKVWGFIKNSASSTWQFIQKGWDKISGFFVGIWEGIKKGFQAVVDFIKGHTTLFVIIFSPLILALAGVILIVGALVKVFQFVWDFIVSLFSGTPAFFNNVFQAAVDVVITIWDVVVSFFSAIWDGISAAFSAVVSFFGGIFSAAWDAITAVWSLVSGWFNVNVLQPIFTLFTPVADFFRERFQTAWTNIMIIFGAVGSWFGQRWANIKANFAEVGSFFAGVFQDAWNRITAVFSTLAAWFKVNVWDRIVSIFTSVGTAVGDAISGAVRSVINTLLKAAVIPINTFLGLLRGAVRIINDAHLPGVHIDGSGLNNITAPQLAKGGIIDQPTLAMVGEAGKEAIVPLENNTEWINTLASKINSKQNTGEPIQLIVQIGEDKIATKVIELINERTIMSGRNAIYV